MKLDLLATGLHPLTAARILELARSDGKVERYLTGPDNVVIPFKRAVATVGTPLDGEDEPNGAGYGGAA